MSTVKQFVCIQDACSLGEPLCLPIDTTDQLESALDAMDEYEVDCLAVWVGHPDSPDSYPTSELLLARASEQDVDCEY